MKAMRFTPPGYGGSRRDPETVKRDGWREEGCFAAMLNDDRLTWSERVSARSTEIAVTRRETRTRLCDRARSSGA